MIGLGYKFKAEDGGYIRNMKIGLKKFVIEWGKVFLGNVNNCVTIFTS